MSRISLVVSAIIVLQTCFAAAWADRDDSAAPNAQKPPQLGEPQAPATQPAQTQPARQGIDQQILQCFGLRDDLAGHGITFAGSLTFDYSKNLTGGISTASEATRDLLDLRFNLDTQELLGLAGGTFSIDFQNQDGPNGSNRIVGDLQGFDGIDANGRTQISELWYQQATADQKFRVKIGKVDANTEFDAVPAAAGFLNSGFSYSPTNFYFPTYPDPAMSVNAFYTPSPAWYAGAGAYDGSLAVHFPTGTYGPKRFFDGPGDYYLIGEAGYRWSFDNKTLPGRVAAGGWYNTATVARFDGQNQSGFGGAYVRAEQTLWHKDQGNPTDPVGIGAFLMYGYADPHVIPITESVGGGVCWTGPIDTPSRQADCLGVGISYAGLTGAPNTGFTSNHEVAFEGYYGLQLASYFQIKPDLQYIITPGGKHADALVATLRITLTF